MEAVSPLIDEDGTRTAARHSPLLGLLEKAAPMGWSLVVRDVPSLAEHDPRGPFKQTMHRLLSDIKPPSAGATPLELEHEFPTGYLRLRLLPHRYDHPIVCEPSVTTISNTEARIARNCSQALTGAGLKDTCFLGDQRQWQCQRS